MISSNAALLQSSCKLTQKEIRNLLFTISPLSQV